MDHMTSLRLHSTVMGIFAAIAIGYPLATLSIELAWPPLLRAAIAVLCLGMMAGTRHVFINLDVWRGARAARREARRRQSRP